MTATEIEQRTAASTRWTVDRDGTFVEFAVKTFWGLTTVRGRFDRIGGSYELGPSGTTIELTIDADSIDTGNRTRDEHLRSADFFDVERHPVMTYRSTGVREVDDGFLVDGELSLHGISRPVTLALQVEGILASSPFGDTRIGFSATAEINRSDFDINFGIADAGGVGLGDKVQITLEVEAILQPDT
jgi:polyisoprenoid-binding protein YceI